MLSHVVLTAPTAVLQVLRSALLSTWLQKGLELAHLEDGRVMLVGLTLLGLNV